ncbi:tubulin polyglutamylase complex subunit 2-like [Actinia tenebrosa]|uniref:Tubulin polyglutamylase complex subunit 2-like n=1 Tax=Actinia tenebrosa TaxID=6105 RepID=A0A6P8H6C1_ACTTE|nr:tubulin polyglutamylase complex subunit 2-like [Actinia tenebrosa]
MASFSEQARMKELFNKMTLGVVRSLENRPGVTEVRLLDRKPAAKSIIDTWEQSNMCILPQDIRSFFLTSNGLLIQWCVKFGGNMFPLGKMEINSVAGLIPLTKSQTPADDNPSLLDVDSLTDEEDEQGHVKPHFDNRCKVFEVDPCDGSGKVCLVYKHIRAGVTTSQPEVWFLDRSLEWSFLANNFSDYFRMMITHLGLPLWQYIFTSTGISPETKQWFNLYAPMRLAIDTEFSTICDEISSGEGNPLNKLDINRLFKGKVDKSRGRPPQAKKPQGTRTSHTRTGQRGVTR